MPTKKPQPVPTVEFDADVDLEDAEVQAEVKEIQTAAKERFSLEDRLNERHYDTKNVLVFLDMRAASEYGRMQAELDRAAQIIGNLEPGAQRESLQKTYDEAEVEAEEKRDEMMKGALSIHLVAIPQVAFEATQRAARKQMGFKGQIPQDKLEQFTEVNTNLAIGQAIVKIVQSDGAEADFDRKTVGAKLRGQLEIPQWNRLNAAFNALVFSDAISRAATADPGF